MWTQHLAQVWHTAGRKYLWTVQINLKLKNCETGHFQFIISALIKIQSHWLRNVANMSCLQDPKFNNLQAGKISESRWAEVHFVLRFRYHGWWTVCSDVLG